MTRDAAQPVKFTINGSEFGLLASGNFQNDEPRAWLQIIRGVRRRYGSRGYRLYVELRKDDAQELAGYLHSVAGVVGSMSAEERDGGSEHRLASSLAERIEEAIRKA